MRPMIESDTIAAIATAAGRSGIGVVRISGPRVASLIAAIIGRPLAPRRAVLAEFRGARGEIIDQGLALYYPAPHSYTGEDVLELQGHGGPVVLRELLKRCLEEGARVARPGEFTERAFLNDKLDLAQAESVADLIDAATAEGARSALRSLRGAFSQRVEELSRAVIELRTLVEATLDFPDEEIEFLRQADAQAKLSALRAKLAEVLAATRQGSLLREGIRVVLAGAPNVGKSSLLNQLAGEELAIVTEIPGTTRDAIRQSINLEGVPAHIIDTAGLRETTDPVEQIGVARTWEAIQNADLVVILRDAREAPATMDAGMLARLPTALPRIQVMNKIDLTSREPAREPGEIETIWLSAKTGAGLDMLRQAILEAAGWKGSGEGEGLFMARARHVHALQEAHAHLERATVEGAQLELLAEELRLAQESLEAVTGRYTADDLLGEIFSHFCIGK
jgi:tRNA modification GTPase